MLKYLLLVLLILTMTSTPVTAQASIWYGTYPNNPRLNTFAADLGPTYSAVVELPLAFYRWQDRQYEPLLAEDWGFVEQPRAYFVQLRDDARWSDGSPISADDIIATFTIGRILNWPVFAYLNAIEKLNEQTVRFVFKSEASRIAEYFILRTPIRSAAVYGEFADRAASMYANGFSRGDAVWINLADEIYAFQPEVILASGPYIYSLDAVEPLILQRQPNSLFSDKVGFDEIHLWPNEAPDMSLPDNLRAVSTPGQTSTGLLFNHDIYPWNLPTVRQAIARIIDRDAVAPPGTQPIRYMSGLPDHVASAWVPALNELDPYTPDKDRAAQQLHEVGLELDTTWSDSDGYAISPILKYPDDQASMALAIVDQLVDSGFTITPQAVPSEQMLEVVRTGDFELALASWDTPAIPFPAFYLYCPLQCLNYVELREMGMRGMNYTMEFEWEGRYVNLDRMIDSLYLGTDMEAQVSTITQIINQQLPFVPLNTDVDIQFFPALPGLPSANSPILTNPVGDDYFLSYYLLMGNMTPTP